MNKLIFKTLYEYSLSLVYSSGYNSLILLGLLTIVPPMTYSFYLRHSLFSKNNKKLLVVSIDYDGTFDTQEGEMVIINWIKSVSKHYNDVLILNGSARQTHYLDQFNQFHNQNGSVNKIKMSAQQHQFKFDNFRLQNTWCHDKEEPKYSLPESFIQLVQVVHEYKLDLIYAQMHHIYESYQEDSIDFVFIDDREDILRHINHNTDILVPEHISLTCMIFDDFSALKVYGLPSEGKLKFNPSWRNNILDIESPLHSNHNIKLKTC